MSLVGLLYHVENQMLITTSSLMQSNGADHLGPHIVQMLLLLGLRERKEKCAQALKGLCLHFIGQSKSRGLGTLNAILGCLEGGLEVPVHSTDEAHTPSDM